MQRMRIRNPDSTVDARALSGRTWMAESMEEGWQCEEQEQAGKSAAMDNRGALAAVFRSRVGKRWFEVGGASELLRQPEAVEAAEDVVARIKRIHQEQSAKFEAA